MKIPFVDLAAAHAELLSELQLAVAAVLERGRYIEAEEVCALEHELAQFIGVNEVVTVNSGTDALVLALRALDIGPGCEVIVPAYTFIATAAAVVLVGARPVFVDCAEGSYLPDAAAIARAITERTRAVVPVHLFGQSASMQEIMELARARGVAVIEDVAQAFGGSYRERRLGAWGTLAAFSFYPTKNLGGIGDGGAIATDDIALAQRLRRLRNHGRTAHDCHIEIGANSRLDEIQAAALRIKLRYVTAWNKHRQRIARHYREVLADLPLQLPSQVEEHIYNQFIIAVPQRGQVQEVLARQGIETAVYYRRACHQQPALAALGPWPPLPRAEQLAQTVLALPIYPGLGDDAVAAVGEALRRALAH